MTTLNLFLDSDIHFSSKGIRSDKQNHLSLMKELSKSISIDAIICAGDLTEHGYDGSKFLCWKFGGDEDQITPLKNYVKEIEKEVTPFIYLCLGNHDKYPLEFFPFKNMGVTSYIKQKHGDLVYSWELTKNNVKIYFYCLNLCPSGNSLSYLKKELKERTKTDNIIIYFHYCITGSFSDWWTEEEKEAFYQVIKDHNILTIIVGHRHQNWLDKWKEFTVVSGAGSPLMLCQIKIDGNSSNVQIIEY